MTNIKQILVTLLVFIHIKSSYGFKKTYILDESADQKNGSYNYFNKILTINIPKMNIDNQFKNYYEHKFSNILKDIEYNSNGITIEELENEEKYIKNINAIDGYIDNRGIYRYY